MQIAKVYVNELEAQTIYAKKITKGLRGGRVSLEYAGGIWEGLTKNVAFTNGLETVGIYGAGLEVEIPPEVTETAGVEIRVGVCGVDGTGVVIPTVWASLGEVLEAVPSDFEEADKELTPSVTEQLLSLIGPMDQLGTEAKDSLVAAINEMIKLAGGDIDPEVLAAAVKEYLAANPIQETDPTVPAWAKQPTKPEYTAKEVGAQPKGDYALRDDLPGAVVFHISYVDEIYGYSHTVEELYSAYQKGANITCVCDISPNRIFNLKAATDTEIVFECLDVDGEAKRTRISRIVYTEGRFNMETDFVTVPTVPTKVSAFANDKGYQTEAEVNALINTALGVIENGTY